MKKTPSSTKLTGILTLCAALFLTQLPTFASGSHPMLGIGRATGYAPRDSTFSVKLSSDPKLLKAQTTLTLHVGHYKSLRYLKVCDLIGKKVFFQSLDYKPGTDTYKIKLASLRPGIYLCSVYSDKGLVETRKLVHF